MHGTRGFQITKRLNFAAGHYVNLAHFLCELGHLALSFFSTGIS